MALWAVPSAQGQDPAPAANPLRGVELERPPNRIRRQISQLDALAAAKEWAEAVELVQTLMADSQGGVAVVDAAPGLSLCLTDYCHLRLTAFPPEALKLYRDAVDPSARARYERAIAIRDAVELTKIVDDSFCSSWADDALLALSEFALERGDHTAARRHLRRLSPLLSDPVGGPLARSLRGVDLQRHSQVVVERLRSTGRPTDRLVYPDTDLPPGKLLSRLVVASIHERDFERAAIELNLLRALAPEESGRIGGREVPLAEALDSLLRSAQQWPAVTSKQQVLGPLIGRIWPQPLPLTAPLGRVALGGQAGEAAADSPPWEPTAWGRYLLLREDRALRAIDLVTGEPAITKNGELHREASPSSRPSRPRVVIQGLNIRPLVVPGQRSQVSDPVVLYQGVWYARVRGDQRLAGGARWRILGRDLSRENLTTLEIPPPESPWDFGGPPVLADGKLYVALSADDVRPRVAVACYSAASGRELWRTPVCSGQPSAFGGFERSASFRLTLGADAVYFNTNLGAVAALDLRDGRVRWIRLYEPTKQSDVSAVAARLSAGSLLHRGSLVVAPDDSDNLLALDEATGKTLWRREKPKGEAQLLGVTEGVLVVGGRQLTGLSVTDGALRYRWPESPKAGVRGMGRGCLVGGEVVWPSRDRVFVFDAQTGVQTRMSLDIADLGGEGGNVLPAAGLLVVAGAKKMTVFGPVNRQLPRNAPALTSAPADAVLLRGELVAATHTD